MASRLHADIVATTKLDKYGVTSSNKKIRHADDRKNRQISVSFNPATSSLLPLRSQSMTLRSFNVLWCLLVIRNSQAQCTLCVDPQDPANDNPSASVGGVECASIAEGIASLPSNSSLCLETQGSAYVNCNCRAFPEEYFCAVRCRCAACLVATNLFQSTHLRFHC